MCAVLVTDLGGFEKLLAVPKAEGGTGEPQVVAYLVTLDDWSLCPHIQGLVFNMTSSNTGLHSGACTLIEELRRELM